MTQVLNIDGMSCPHCAAKVKSALEAVDGVETALVNHAENSATVTLGAIVAESDYATAVAEAGYTFVSARSDG